MSEKLKPKLHIDNDYFSDVLSLSEEDRAIFLVELYELLVSKERTSQFLDVAHRTMNEASYKEIEEWILNKGVR